MPSKITRTFSLTPPTDDLLTLLSRSDERKRSAELRILIIRYAEDSLQNPRVTGDIRAKIERLIEQAKSEVYEPDPEPEGDDDMPL